MSTLSKETLNKMLTVLETEENERHEAYKSSLAQRKELFTLGSFFVQDVEKRWSSKEENIPNYRIEFEAVAERDLNFHCETDDEFAKQWGWAGWSFSREKDVEESEKNLSRCESYVALVSEMISHLQNFQTVKDVMAKAVAWTEENVNPLQSDYYKVKSEIEEVKKQITQIEKDNELEEAKKFVVPGKKFYFAKYFDFSSRNTTTYIRVEQKGKKLVCYTDNYEGSRAITLTDALILDIYKHCIRIVADYQWVLEGDNYYYKHANLLTEEQYKDRSLIEKTTITKEEFQKIR